MALDSGTRSKEAGRTLPLTSLGPWAAKQRATKDGGQSPSVIVSTSNALIRSRIVECLRDLAVSFELVPPWRLDVRDHGGSLYVLDDETLQGLADSPCRTIVVFMDNSYTLSLMYQAALGHVIPINYDWLDPASLTRAIMRAVGGDDVVGLAAHLSSHDALALVPKRIIRSFVLHPDRMTRLNDVCRVLAVSPATARSIVKRAGFLRSEYLMVKLRAESWVWFRRRGFRRSIVEEHMGITDRSHFRRACARAGIAVPWRTETASERELG